MKILFLGPNNISQINIINFLKKDGNEVIRLNKNIANNNIDNDYKILLSFGYKYKIEKKIIEKFSYNCFNLHISYLPWNKGADPNFWSFAEDTPRGVSIHVINDKIDEGPVIFRKKTSFKPDDTLYSSYNSLLLSMEKLFYEKWRLIKLKKFKKKITHEKGTFHKSKDINNFSDYLINGWDTKVSSLIGIAK